MERITLLQNQLSQSAPYQKIITEVVENGSIGIITLNDQKELNSLSTELMLELFLALQAFNQQQSVKVIIIKSAVEKAFCAGANLKQLSKISIETQQHNDYVDNFEKAFLQSKKPIIALVNGLAFGGGFEMALASDIILMAENAKLCFPEMNLGLLPGIGGTQRLTHIIGKHNVMKMVLNPEPITAQEANRLGICQGLYKKEELFDQGIALAKKIASKSGTSLILAKRAVLLANETGLTQGLKSERDLFNAAIGSKASREGINAFLEKRKPNFDKL